MAARAITSARLASVGFKKPVAARSTFAGKRVSILPAQVSTIDVRAVTQTSLAHELPSPRFGSRTSQARKVVVRAEETDVDKLVSDLSKKVSGRACNSAHRAAMSPPKPRG